MIPFDTGFAKVVKKYRLKAGLSQAKVARLCKCTSLTILKLENGKTEPWFGTACLLAYVLRIPQNELMPQIPSCFQQVEGRDVWPPPPVEPSFIPPVGPEYDANVHQAGKKEKKLKRKSLTKPIDEALDKSERRKK